MLPLSFSELKFQVKQGSLGTKTFYMVPTELRNAKRDDYHLLPYKMSVDVTANPSKNGKKAMHFCKEFNNLGPQNYDFFLDKEIADAHATKILLDKQNLIKGELSAFELLTNVKTKANKYLEIYPSIFV